MDATNLFLTPILLSAHTFTDNKSVCTLAHINLYGDRAFPTADITKARLYDADYGNNAFAYAYLLFNYKANNNHENINEAEIKNMRAPLPAITRALRKKYSRLTFLLTEMLNINNINTTKLKRKIIV